jgi:hypothetical protein
MLETNLETWAEASPEVLGEDLLVIGRQVAVDNGRDRIDLLALDLAANLIIIELKRDWIGADADLQAVRYASMVATWDHATIRRLAEEYWNSVGRSRGTFTQELDEFCDEGYELNGIQRIILAGRRVNPRVGTMVMWLRAHAIDVRVVTLGLFRDADSLYLQPQVVIPLPTEDSFVAKPSPGQADKEWQRDGRSWHLEERLSEQGREIVELMMGLIEEAAPEADGPGFAQKQYIAWRAGPRNWLSCHTSSPHQAAVFVQGLTHSTPEDLASRLGWETFDREAELADKLALGSSVGRDRHGRMRFIIKDPKDLVGGTRATLAEVLRAAWEGFSTGHTGSRLGDQDL